MLREILDSVRARIEGSDRAHWQAAAGDAPPPRPFRPALAAAGLSVIAEVKRRSPSVGDIAPDLDAGPLARRYEAGGAAAVSVLTESAFFGARPDDLATVRASIGLPVLRKDFILDPVQVWETRAMGADAVLLIVAILDDDLLGRLMDEARAAALDALVEVHTPREGERALAAGADTIGVNNRDLETFRVDLTTADSIRPLLGSGVVTVAESGVAEPSAARRMRDGGYDAILVGEAAVRSEDPAAFVASLVDPR